MAAGKKIMVFSVCWIVASILAQAQGQEPPPIPKILIPRDSMPTGIKIEGLKIKAGVPLDLTWCVAKYLGPEQRIFKVIAADFPASPSGGESGRGFSDSSQFFVADWGSLDLALDGSEKKRRGLMKFTQGELVRLGRAEDFFSKGEHLIQVTRTDSGETLNILNIQLQSIFKHNITRGRGANQHESPEILNSSLVVPLDVSCERFKTIWAKFFKSADTAELEAAMKNSPSGVMVEEIKEGMTPSAVEAILGPPERKATIGGKTIYFYPRMKITFTGQRVTGIE